MPANDINLEKGLGQKVYWPHMQMTFAPERQPSSSSSLSLFTLKLLPRRRQLKLKTYLTPFRCISCRRHPLRMSNVCFSPIAGWLCEVFSRRAFHCAGIINADRKANMWKYAPYQLLDPLRAAPRSNCSPNQAASQAVSEQASLEACLHSRC